MPDGAGLSSRFRRSAPVWKLKPSDVGDALAAALRRVEPGLRGAAFDRELAWLTAEVRLSGRGCIGWGAMPLGQALRDRMAEAQNWRCCWCGKDMSPNAAATHAGDRPTFEHVEMLCEGGADHPDNLAVACGDCNVRRSARHGGVAADA